MTKKISVFVLLSATLCAGQSVTSISGTLGQSSASDREGSPTRYLPAGPVVGDSWQRLPVASNTRLETITAKAHNTVITEQDIGDVESEAAPVAPRAHRQSARTEFEIFADDAAGETLKVFGRRLFEDVPSTFAPVDRIPVSADYVIGPGDELLIRIWGKIDLEARVTVDRNGEISLPKVGTVNVAALRFDQLQSYLHTAVGRLFKDFELNVALGKLRSIQILVLGHARQPGGFTVSSLSTLVDALFTCGGPSSTGTMRHIQLRRSNRLVTEFDLYDLQQKGDKSRDVQLLPGDEIYIPPIGSQVAIVGSVNEPGIFELKGDTTIENALEGAGGLTTLAATDRVLLERIANHAMRRVDELTLQAPDLQRILRDGDLLRIAPISPRFENAVTIRGNVAEPGRFPWREGMRVSDLIPSRGFLVTSDHWNLQNHLGDELHTDLLADIDKTNAEVNWDYAAIERLDEHDLSTRLVAFNLGDAIDNPASLNNQLLKVGDILTIFSRRDLPLPLTKHATFVRLGGEINAPGVYRVNPGDSLRNVVERAGGLTPDSYLYASQLTRASTRRVQEAELKLSINRMQKELLAHSVTDERAGGISSAAGVSNIIPGAEMGAQKALVAELATVQPTGRIVLGIGPDAKTVADIPEFPLEDGDSFYVPARLGTVQVAGEVYNENAFRYQPKKRLSSYVDDSGGATRLADVKKIFLVRADGTVVSRQSGSRHWPHNFGEIVLMPGDAIIVPAKLTAPGGFMHSLPLLTQILSQTAMTGAVLSLIH